MKLFQPKFYTSKIFRFIIGGGFNTLFTYGIYFAFSLVINYQIAFLIAYILGIIFAYWFNAVIVFRVSLSWKKLSTYPLAYLAQYILSALFLNIFVEQFGIHPHLALPIIVTGMVPIMFAMNKWLLEGSKKLQME